MDWGDNEKVIITISYVMSNQSPFAIPNPNFFYSKKFNFKI